MNTKIKNLSLLGRCLAYTLVRRTAKGSRVDSKNILVIQRAKLGDMVCTTPLFRALKSRYPHCRLTVVGTKLNGELLEHNSDVDEYLAFDDGDDTEVLTAKIKKGSFDFGCTVIPDFQALAAMYLGEVEVIVAPKVTGGWSPYETKPYRLLRCLVKVRSHHMNAYAPREYLRLLEPVGIQTADTLKHLGYSAEATRSAARLLAEQGFIESDISVAIAPSAGNKIKNWGGKRFAEVANRLVEEYRAKIIVIGSERDRAEAGEMMAGIVSTDRVVDTVGKLSVDELKALIARMKLFVSADTGPLYIAEAFGIPTVDILGPMSETEQPPQGKMHRVVFDRFRKAPEIHIMNARVYNEREARRQMEAITIPMVMEETRALIRLIQNHPHE